jgi:C-terminal processing protease CtpA/Prc
MSKTFIFFLLIIAIFVQVSFSQTVTVNEVASPASVKLNRERGNNMLDEIKESLKTYYYDKTYRGINLDDRFKSAKEKIKTLDSNARIFKTIAQVVLEFQDSHTRFIPPSRANRVEYGFSLQMIGDKCFAVDVKKGSDAEKKGLKVGDPVVGIGKFNPTRENLWVVQYLLYTLDPQSVISLHTLNSDKTERELIIEATFKSIKDRQKEAEAKRKEKKENPYKCQEIDSNTIACKLRSFSVEKKYIEKMMAEVGQHGNMILDLRGNGGGYVKIEELLTGYFFEKDIKIADFIMRDKKKERIAKTQKEKTYKGKLIVLIDSNSASASEVFSRVIQLEKRGTIIGDTSAGAVMTSIFVTMENGRGVPGFETFSFFGMSITVADLIMSDGNRLENFGVLPDVGIGPTGFALLNGQDPVLAYAAGKFDAKLTPEQAGKYYFLTKKPEDEEDEETDDN